MQTELSIGKIMQRTSLTKGLFPALWIATILYKFHLLLIKVGSIDTLFIAYFPFVFYQDFLFFIGGRILYDRAQNLTGAVQKTIIVLLMIFYMFLLGLSHVALVIAGISFDVGMIYTIMFQWSEFSEMASSEKELTLLKAIYSLYFFLIMVFWCLRSIHSHYTGQSNTTKKSWVRRLKFKRLTMFVAISYWLIYIPTCLYATFGTQWSFASRNLLFKSIFDAQSTQLNEIRNSEIPLQELLNSNMEKAKNSKIVNDFNFIRRTNESEIRNVILFSLESGRSDVWPLDYSSDFAKRVLTDEAIRDKDITPFFEYLKSEGAYCNDYLSTVSYTLKALYSMQCSVYPYPADHITEHKMEYYHKCLPTLLKEHGFANVFMQPASTTWMHHRETTVKMGLDVWAREELDKTGSFEKINYFGYADEAIYPSMLEWIDSQVENNQPFYFSYITNVNHHPFNVPKQYPKKNYVKKDIQYDDSINSYLNTVKYTDNFIKNFVEDLDKRNLLESTLIVFTGDHGIVLGENGQFGTAGIRSTSQFHVPALLYTKNERWAQVLKGKLIDGRRSHLDLVPTILDILNENFKYDTRFEYGYDGHSLLHPAIEKPFITLANPGTSVISYFDKNMLLSLDKTEGFQVFDLETDPQMATPLDLSSYKKGSFQDWRKEAEQNLLNNLNEIKARFVSSTSHRENK